LPPAVKDAISHRGQALRALAEQVRATRGGLAGE
jgi:inosine/xanthosine triphosphate pyrophosphatase family protein